MYRFACFTAILLLLATSDPARADHLTVLYFDRPPYYLTLGGRPGGFLVDLTSRILIDAGVPHEFQEMPPKRILEALRSPKGSFCSIGWFKTLERERFAVFSHPIYQDRPFVAVFLKHGRVRPPAVDSLKALCSRADLVLGVNAAFSYGQAVDAILDKAASPPLNVNVSQEQLMRMLAAQRFDYMLANPEEIGALTALAGLKEADLEVVRLDDVPRGNLRYLMFSKDTPAETIRRVNAAIDRLVRID